MRDIITRQILLFFLISTTFSGIAQDAKFKIFTKDDGLLSSTVSSIVQDTNGFLWIGTDAGLNRFDGYEFRSYQNNPGDSTTLIGNRIFELLIDKYSRLLVATTSGYCIYNPLTDDFAPVPGKINTYGKDIDQDGLGNYYFIVGGQRCHITDSAFNDIGEISTVVDNSLIPNFTPGVACVDKDGDMWFTVHNANGVAYYNPKTRKYNIYKHEPDNPNSIINGNMTTVNCDAYNTIWVSGLQGFSRIIKNENIIEQKPTPNNFLIYNARTSAITMDPLGRYWVASQRSGISSYDPKNDIFVRYAPNELDIEALHSGTYNEAFPDEQGNIWAYGGNTNLNLKYLDIKNFVHIRRIPGEENTLKSNRLLSMDFCQGKDLWIGTNSGISIYTPSTQQFRDIEIDVAKPFSLRHSYVTGIYETQKGDIYVSSFKTGLYRWTGEGSKFINLNDSVPELPLDQAMSITEDDQGNLWCGTAGSGLYRFDPETKKVDIFNSNSVDWKAGIDNFVVDVFIDKGGLIYVSQNGLAMIDLQKKTIKSFKRDDGYLAKALDHAYEDDLGHIWLSTDIGLAKYEAEDNKFTFYAKNEGFPGSKAAAVLSDELGNLWVSSDNGLSRFNPNTEEFSNYYKSDGLQDNEFIGGLACKGDDGTFYFGGVKGVTQFRPAEIRKNQVPPKMKLTGLKLFNKPVEIGEKSILKTDIKFQDRIKLKHYQNVVTIDYVAINYFHPEKNQYKYIMEGFEKEWQDAGTSRSATYTNLNPGKYTFKVIGSNNDGVWTDKPATIRLHVRPPWYRTKLFYLFILGVIGFIIYLYLSWRNRIADRDKRIIQEKLDNADKEIEKQKQILIDQQVEIKKRDEAEKEIRFVNAGLAKFAELISRDRKKLFRLTQNIIVELTKYVEANAGALYLISDDNNDQLLRLMGSYALKQSSSSTSIVIGEGYIGTCYKDKKTLKLDNITDGYVQLESGLGQIDIKNLVLAPIRNEEDVLGVIEIASFKSLEKYKVEFIEKIGENIGSTLAVARANKKAREMLEENRIQSEELMAQEEEMRQNIEELQATQEDFNRQQDELKQELKKKKEHIYSLEEELKILREENQKRDDF